MENKLSLYNITNSFITLFEKAENGELTPEEIQEQGNDLALALKNKSTSIIGYVRNSELMSEAIKNEIDRLTAMKKAVDNRIDKFKEYVKENMERLDIPKIDTEIGTMSISKNPASVEIYDETLITDKYKKSKITVAIDKAAIKNDLKAGKEVKGARLIENKTSLRIK